MCDVQNIYVKHLSLFID